MKAWLRALAAPVGIAAVAGIAVAIGVHAWLAGAEDHEAGRAHYLKGEIAKLDRDLVEMQSLQEQFTTILARKRVVEVVHAERLRSVRLLDQLARERPDGVILKAVRHQGATVNLSGSAPSLASLWRFIKNLEAASLLERPELVEVKAVDASRIEFDLNIHLRRPQDG